MKLRQMQKKYILSGIVLLPVSPFFYLQARYTRWKVGRLPEAVGAKTGTVDGAQETIRILVLGESSAAGVGAKKHERALAGQFAKHLNHHTGKKISWHVIGESGITIEKTNERLVPQIESESFDLALVALGGNDVFGLTSPKTFRADLEDLLKLLKSKSPDAMIFLANVPMVKTFAGMPNPLRYTLSRLAKLHHFNAIDLVSNYPRVFYFADPKPVDDDFFSDGIHPSEIGYDLWSKAMVEFYMEHVDNI